MKKVPAIPYVKHYILGQDGAHIIVLTSNHCQRQNADEEFRGCYTVSIKGVICEENQLKFSQTKCSKHPSVREITSQALLQSSLPWLAGEQN